MTTKTKKPVKKAKPIVQAKPLVWPLNEKQTFWLCAGVITLITFVIFSKYLFGPNLFIFNDVGSDTLTIFYPNLVEASRYFQEVGIPGWSFYVGLGSNTYPGFLNSPLHLIYLPMDPVTIAYSIAWVQAGVMIATGLVFYRFLREAEFALPVRLIGATIYAFGGYLVIGSSWYGHSHAIFWMTVAFLGFEMLLRKKNWWLFVIPFVALLGTRAYFLVLFFSVYSLIRLLDHYGSNWKEILGSYKRLIYCGIFAVLVALPFIGGEWHRFRYSPRVSGDVSYSDELAEKSIFHTANQEHMLTAFYRFISNDALGAGDDFVGWKNYLEAPAFYIGLLTILLVFQFFALTTPRRRWLYGGLLAFWCILIVFPWFRFAFYGFAGNYYKGGLSLFIPFTFLFIGLMGLQEMITRKKVNLPVAIGSFFLVMILMWLPYDEENITLWQPALLQASVFLTGYLILMFGLWSGVGNKFLLPVLYGMVVLEAGLFSWPAFNDRIPILKSDIAQKKFHFDDSMDAAAWIREHDKDLFYRTDKVFGSVKSGFNDGMVQGFFGSKMYQSHNHKNYVRFLSDMGSIDGSQEANTRWLIGLAFNQLLHPLFSIKYVLSNSTSADMVDKVIYKKVHQAGDVTISQNNYFIPFGIPFDEYLDYDEFMLLSNRDKRMAIYKGVVIEDENVSPGFLLPKWDTTQVVNLSQDVNEKLTTIQDKAMKMEFFNHKRIIGSINLDVPSMVFFSIPFDIGWKAKVDDKPEKLTQVNIGFTGLLLPAGNHSIELNYEPPLSTWGWIGWVAAALSLWLVYRYRHLFWK